MVYPVQIVIYPAWFIVILNNTQLCFCMYIYQRKNCITKILHTYFEHIMRLLGYLTVYYRLLVYPIGLEGEALYNFREFASKHKI